MKTRLLLGSALAALMIGLAPAAAAQVADDAAQQRKEQMERNRRLLSEKASKDARKQAKEMKKQGWTVGVGALPLEKQIDRSMMMQIDLDPSGRSAWLMGEANSVGSNLDAARFAAMELAKVNIVQQMEQEISGNVEQALGNQQITADQAASVMQTVGQFQTIFSHRLAGMQPIVSVFRKLSSGQYEARVTLFYSRAEMNNMAREAIAGQLLQNIREQKKVDFIVNDICGIGN